MKNSTTLYVKPKKFHKAIDDDRRELFQKSSARFICRIKEDGANNYFAHYVYFVDIDGVKKVKSCVPAHCSKRFIASLKKSDYYKSWF